ncbi:hypothetical protein VFPPC_17636 [Pochonia chlamydosporia 170]|uniref:Uncharacterized protein n=1 Tax=Pochonia chlamydosporia 170 TaxID=1380566 RepID=A0A219AQX3_METCM|nr:hypothetical protein VFPPC_17636 [Pochonia chlamydosporia 170]OWT43188.1 hypothetical protein VFPPC_17636 [Pochonia chlamydosporia 170]
MLVRHKLRDLIQTFRMEETERKENKQTGRRIRRSTRCNNFRRKERENRLQHGVIRLIPLPPLVLLRSLLVSPISGPNAGGASSCSLRPTPCCPGRLLGVNSLDRTDAIAQFCCPSIGCHGRRDSVDGLRRLRVKFPRHLFLVYHVFGKKTLLPVSK